MADNTFQNIRDATYYIERQLVDMANKLDAQNAKKALDVVGAMIVRSIRQHVPVANRIVKRYSRNRLYATYHPGNLKRSIKQLNFKFKSSTNRHVSFVWIGPEMQPRGGKSRGEFKGDRVDGKYAWYVEYGRRKNPYMRPGIDAVEDKAMAYLRSFVNKVLNARK